MQPSTLIWLVPLFPLLSGILVGLMALVTSRKPEGPSRWLVAALGCLGPFAACWVAIQLFGATASHEKGFYQHLYTWFAVGNLDISMDFAVDRLSAVMIMIVTFVGSLIHLYSVGYMWEDRGFARFFSYLNLFTFAMLVLVLGKNLPLMFLGWEGVGAASYLLIGFWYDDTAKAIAANKAFIVNRIGDFGMLLGIFTLFFYMGSHGVWSLDFFVLREHASQFTPVMATVIGLLLFVGAMGKSAQIPLHVWLADAMAGPTPVSALIHAATMVTAGVYLVARMAFMYSLSPTAGQVIATIGVLTALMAATIAITQSNIKKVLAYSTVSQLGYMFVGVGAGAYSSGVFHLFTHAFFKALLFLGAGSVIHAMHHEEDMSQYGGLKKFIPLTWIVMFIACLAIAGIPPFAGFFSKDAILAAAWEKGWTWIYVVGLVTSCITAFYMFRMLFLTFWGAPRGAHAGAVHDHEGSSHADAHGHDHLTTHGHHGHHGRLTPHEGPWQMWLPLVLLATGTCFVGFLGMPEAWGGSSFSAWLAPAFPVVKAVEVDPSLEWTLMAMAVSAGGLGILFAWLRYGSHTLPRFLKHRNFVYQLLAHKYYFDEAYRFLIVRPLVWFSGWGLWKIVDLSVIDGFVNTVPRLYLGFSNTVRFAQTGAVRLYAYAMLVGAIAIFTLVMSRYALFH